MRNLGVASLIMVLLLAVVLGGCKSNINYEEEIQGKWICQEVDQFIIPTNDVFSLTFSSHTLSFAKGYALPDGKGSSWFESHDAQYQINDNMLSITGTNPLGKAIDALLEIRKVNSRQLILQEKHLLVDNVNVSAGRQYELYKTRDLDMQRLVGKWELRTISGEDSVSTPLCLYEFIQDYKYNTYTANGGNWELEEDMEGRFGIYGDIISLFEWYPSTDNYEYECYILNEVTSQRMIWRQWNRIPGTSHDLQGKRYELRKVM